MPAQRQPFYSPGGLDVSVQDNQIQPFKSPDVSNFIFEDGRMKTTPGLAKVNTNAFSSYEKAINVTTWRDLQGSVHRLAATEHHIYELNDDGTTTSRSDNGLWLRSRWAPGMDDPVWFHAATSGSEYLCIACKAEAPLFKWDGRASEFTRLKTTYNGSEISELWPIQSTMYYNRLFLLSPAIVDAGSGTYTTNDQMVLWSKINDIENWDDGNAGFVILVDTGGVNVGMLQQNCQMVVYQDNAIWNLHHVGGTSVFKPICAITDYGLWGARLLAPVGKLHYFVNSFDGNVYRYSGGTVEPQAVGNDIWPNLRADLDTSRAFPNRSFMVYEPIRDRLHVFVANALGDCTKDYFLDRRSGEWGIRDYSGLTAGSTGLTGGHYDKYTDRALLLSSAGSFVYNQKASNTDDDGAAIASYRLSRVIDHGEPDVKKRWHTMALEARGRVADDLLVVSIRLNGGEWDNIATLKLSTSWKKYRINLANKGGHNIQIRVTNSSGSIIEVRSMRDPSFEYVREL